MTTQEQQPAQPAQIPASRPASLAASAEPVATATLTGAQLLQALDYVAPDRDADQLEAEVVIAYGDGHAGKGYYCWILDCPDEGAIMLEEALPESYPFPHDPVARPAADERAPVGDEIPHWEEVSAKIRRDEKLTPLELFVHENEPSSDSETWRDQLAAALESAPVAGEAQPVIHQHGFAADNQRLRAINESLDKQLEEVMTERDEYHDMADKLADAIADHLLVEIGEHSSSNCPWMRALEAIESAAPQASPAADGRDAKDAARYRWLRSLESFREHDDWTIYDGGGNAARGEALDAAIDAAIAAQQGEGGGV